MCAVYTTCLLTEIGSHLISEGHGPKKGRLCVDSTGAWVHSTAWGVCVNVRGHEKGNHKQKTCNQDFNRPIKDDLC